MVVSVSTLNLWVFLCCVLVVVYLVCYLLGLFGLLIVRL